MFPIPDNIISDYDALIMDLDGTVLDSMGLWNEVDIVFLSKRGIELTSDYTDYVKSVRIEQAAEYTARRYGLTETPQEIMDEWLAMVDEAYRHEISVKPGVIEYLKSARKAGLKLGFATALSFANAKAALENNGIFDLFDVHITLDDMEGDINKEEPDIYLKVAQLLDAAPERCLVFEDIPKALEGARKGHFGTCAVYDEVGSGRKETWEEMKSSSDFHITAWNTSC